MVVGLIRAAYRNADLEVDGFDRACDRVLNRRRPVVSLRHGERGYLRLPIRVGQVEVARLRREEQLSAELGTAPSARHGKHVGGGIACRVDALSVGDVGQHRIGAHDVGDRVALKRRCDAERSLVLAYRHGHKLRALVGDDEMYEVAVRVDKHGADRGRRIDDRHILRLVRIDGDGVALVDVSAAQRHLVADCGIGEACRRVGVAVVILVGVDRVGCLGMDDQRDAVGDGTAAALYLVCDAVIGVESDVADRRAAAADHALDEGLGIVSDRGAADSDFLFFAVHGESDGVLLRGAVVDDLFDGSGALGDDRGAEAAQRDDERAHALSGGLAVILFVNRSGCREHADDAVEPGAYAAAVRGGQVADAVAFPDVLAHLGDRLDGDDRGQVVCIDAVAGPVGLAGGAELVVSHSARREVALGREVVLNEALGVRSEQSQRVAEPLTVGVPLPTTPLTPQAAAAMTPSMVKPFASPTIAPPSAAETEPLP